MYGIINPARFIPCLTLRHSNLIIFIDCPVKSSSITSSKNALNDDIDQRRNNFLASSCFISHPPSPFPFPTSPAPSFSLCMAGAFDLFQSEIWILPLGHFQQICDLTRSHETVESKYVPHRCYCYRRKQRMKQNRRSQKSTTLLWKQNDDRHSCLVATVEMFGPFTFYGIPTPAR